MLALKSKLTLFEAFLEFVVFGPKINRWHTVSSNCCSFTTFFYSLCSQVIFSIMEKTILDIWKVWTKKRRNDHSKVDFILYFPFSMSNPPVNESDCINWNQYYSDCTPGEYNPFNGAISFDNIGLAWVAIFLVRL